MATTTVIIKKSDLSLRLIPWPSGPEIKEIAQAELDPELMVIKWGGDERMLPKYVTVVYDFLEDTLRINGTPYHRKLGSTVLSGIAVGKKQVVTGVRWYLENRPVTVAPSECIPSLEDRSNVREKLEGLKTEAAKPAPKSSPEPESTAKPIVKSSFNGARSQKKVGFKPRSGFYGSEDFATKYSRGSNFESIQRREQG